MHIWLQPLTLLMEHLNVNMLGLFHSTIWKPCVVFCVCVIVVVVVMLIPGTANILKHLKAFKLTLTRHAHFTNICFSTPLVNLTALCTLCVFAGIVVRIHS